MTDDKKIEPGAVTESDDWLNDAGDKAEAGLFSELDQANIDELLAADNLNAPAGSATEPAAPAAEEAVGDLSQDDIDALLGGSAKPAAPAASVADEMIGDLSQDDIDALLGPAGSTAAAAPLGPGGAAMVEELAGDLSQDDIDALLGTTAEPAKSAAPVGRPLADSEEELTGDLHQDDIDALFGGGARKEEQGVRAEESAAGKEGIHEIDKSDLDALLNADTSSEISVGINALIGGGAKAGSGAPAPAAAASGVPSQEEMDRIFFEAMAKEKEKEHENKAAGDDDLFLDEMMGGEAAVGSASTGMKAFDLSEDDFKFGDDLPEIPADREAEQKLAARQPEAPSARASETSAAKKEAAPPKKARMALPAWLRNLRHSRPVMAGTLLGLLLVIGTGLYFSLWHRPGPVPLTGEASREKATETAVGEKPAAGPTPPTVVADKKPPPVPNRPPLVEGGTYQIALNSLGVPVSISGRDEDGDPLTYRIIGQPRFGVLYGDPPKLTYVAGAGFPGQDMFEFEASDGKVESGPAIVRITGPDLARLAARPVEASPVAPPLPRRAKAKPRVETASLEPRDILTEAGALAPPPPQPRPLPENPENIQALSTEPVIIDWARLWRHATNSAFTSKVTVAIESTDTHGQLEKLSPSRSRYVPDPFFVGAESILYRFVSGKKRSKIRRLDLLIANGNPYPQIHLKPLVKEAYAVGDTVELDASATRDDNRETLIFVWEQVAGPRIRFAKVNGEGSVVRFQVPAVFANCKEPAVSLRMTARDSSGQASVSREVQVGIQSRRQSPLWGQVPGEGGASRLPSCPTGDCAAPRLFLSAAQQ